MEKNSNLRFHLKKFTLQTSSGLLLTPIVHETLPYVFTWPASQLLSLFLASNSEQFKNKKVIELGAGTGLVSIVSAMLGSTLVVSTDRDDQIIQNNLIKTIELNNLNRIVYPRPLDWFNTYKLEREFKFDFIIAADVFYSSEDFDQILFQVYSIFLDNPLCKFITAYQERSSSRNLIPLIDKYNMKAKYLSQDSFLHMNHIYQNDLTNPNCSINFENFDHIHLIQIELNAS